MMTSPIDHDPAEFSNRQLLLPRAAIALVLALCVLLGGCATTSMSDSTSSNTEEAEEIELDEGDPWENFNRAIFGFNNKLDKAIVSPLARGYSKLPGPVTTGVGNFFSNLFEPTTIINDLLQGKVGQAIEDSTRFLLNTTVGIAGLFDVAKHVSLPKNDEDFGQTLARWGIGDGPYLVLPLLGPSNVRDTVGKLPYFFVTDPLFYVESQGTRLGARALEITDIRYRLLRTDRLLKMQLDPYIFVREGYWQRRENLIWDGGEPPE